MTKDEIKEYISECLWEYKDQELLEISKLRKELEEEFRDLREEKLYVTNRMKDIENMIHQHAIGVQNVYDELIKIKSLFEDILVEAGKRRSSSLQDIFNAVEEKVERVNERCNFILDKLDDYKQRLFAE